MPFDIDIQAMSIPVPPTPLHLDKMQWGQPTAAIIINTYGPGPSTTMRHTYTSSTKSGLDLNFKSVYAIIVKVLFRKEKRESQVPRKRVEFNWWLNNGCRFRFGSQCICLFDLNSSSDCGGLTKTRNCHSNNEESQSVNFLTFTVKFHSTKSVAPRESTCKRYRGDHFLLWNLSRCAMFIIVWASETNDSLAGRVARHPSSTAQINIQMQRSRDVQYPGHNSTH